MLRKIKSWHFILIVWLIILSLRFNLLIDTSEFLWLSITLLFEDIDFFSSHLSFQMIDSMFAFLIMMMIPVFVSLSKFRNKFLDTEINFSRSFIIILLYCFFLPTLITRGHPDYQKNNPDTRLLSPFSIIYQIKLKTSDKFSLNSNEEKFLKIKEKVVLKEFDEKKFLLKVIH